jgi:hypothetical protein
LWTGVHGINKTRSFSSGGQDGEIADFDVETARKMIVDDQGVLLDVRTPEVRHKCNTWKLSYPPSWE